MATGRQWLAFSETDEYYIECKIQREQQREKTDASHWSHHISSGLLCDFQSSSLNIHNFSKTFSNSCQRGNLGKTKKKKGEQNV